jgi:broad specificity phosphatase PhoE
MLAARIREQEFGNLQDDAQERRGHRVLENLVGKFYYRRPEGESGADVYDRVSDFWESIFQGGAPSSP